MAKRRVPVIRCADDIVILSKSKRAAERLLESNRKYLEGKLKLKMNAEKSKVVSVFAIRNFKFLGFVLGRGKDGIYIRTHAKSLKKAKAERTDFPQLGQKRPRGNEKRKEVHPRMAWLLRNCKHKDDNAELGRMVAPQVPNLYLETVEEP